MVKAGNNNAARKAKRARSLVRGKERKDLRIAVQEAQQKANKALRAAGLPTPDEAASNARAERRAKDPEVQRRRRLHEVNR